MKSEERKSLDERNRAQVTIEQNSKWTKVIISKAVLPIDDLRPMTEFCNMFGYGIFEPDEKALDINSVVWYVFVWYGRYDFYFKNPEDATMFRLRWSC